MKKITIAIIILLIILFYPTRTEAASSLGLFVSPANQEITIMKGQSYTGNILLINHTPNTLQIAANANDFVVNNTQGIPEFLPNSLGNRFSAAYWTQIDKKTFTLTPEAQQTISYTITVPLTAASGGHYTAFIFTGNSVDQTTKNAKITLGVASLLAISVPGQIKENLIGQLQMPFFQEYGPVIFQTTLTNTGDIHLVPKGNLTIKNMFGQIVSTSTISEERIFPQASKTYRLTFPGKWHAGRYIAILHVTYGHSHELTTQATFIVFPWSIAIITLLMLIASVLLFLLLTKKKQPLEKSSSMSFSTEELNK